MSDKYFVDTNILTHAHDKGAGAKHERAKALVEELWRDRTGVVSTQVFQELAVNLRRKAGRPLDTKTTREIISDYLSWQVVVNRAESILEALDIEARYRISFLGRPRHPLGASRDCGRSLFGRPLRRPSIRLRQSGEPVSNASNLSDG